MKRLLIVSMCVLLGMFMVGCGCNGGSGDKPATEAVSEKQDEMTEKAVMYYLTAMTANYSSAYTVAINKDQKNEYLNKAITDINIAMSEIENEYEEGVPPTSELLELGKILKLVIEADMLGDNEGAYEYAVKSGEIIGDLSREYLDGDLPIGIQYMIDKGSQN